MKTLGAKVFWLAAIAPLALLGLSYSNVEALEYGPGFYYDNGESDLISSFKSKISQTIDNISFALCI